MSAIREAIALLEGVTDDAPNLSRDELESRIEDIRIEVESLGTKSVDDLPDAIEGVADALRELYNEV